MMMEHGDMSDAPSLVVLHHRPLRLAAMRGLSSDPSITMQDFVQAESATVNDNKSGVNRRLFFVCLL
jgi:hypothetical protein